jgi:hypothetical protein
MTSDTQQQGEEDAVVDYIQSEMESTVPKTPEEIADGTRHTESSVRQLVEFLANHRFTGVYRCEEGFIFSPSNSPPQFVDLVDDVDDRKLADTEQVQKSE